MNIIVSKFAYVLRARREEKQLSQTKLGKLANVPNKQISKYEIGERIPPPEHLQRLESVLGRLPSPYRFTRLSHNEEWYNFFRDNRRWRRKRDRSLTHRLKSARRWYPSEAKKLQSIIEKHQPWLEDTDTGSSLELMACLLILAYVGVVELVVNPLAWSFRDLAIHDQVTNECISDKDFAGLGLPLEVGRAALIPQVPVMTKDGVIVLDFLVVVRIGDRKIWFALEIDGPGHCSKADALRAEHIGVTRITEAEILSPSFIDILKSRLSAMLDNGVRTTKRAA